MTVQEYKVLENRLRRAADRQGLRLEKARARDPRAVEHGTYRLLDQRTNGVVKQDWDLPRGFGLDLEDVGRFLFEDINIRVDRNPEHDAMTFDDTGDPILSYRSWCTTKAKDKSGRLIPDGWVLAYLDDNDGVDEQIIGAWDLDTAVADAKEYVRKYLR